jgi:DNA-binding GntR family transcriptional regulator
LLSDQAYRLIKHKIATLELPPASLVNEQALTRELGIGRTPVRDALRRLEVENLVTIVPRRGTFVTDVSVTDLQALVEVRIELEGLAARLTARRIDPDQLREMELLFDRFDSLVAAGGNDTLMDRDKRFHHLVYQAAGNAFLEDTLEQFYTLSLRLWYLALDRLHHASMVTATKEHLRIVDAFKRRDADAAEARMQQHVLSFHDQIKAVL